MKLPRRVLKIVATVGLLLAAVTAGCGTDETPPTSASSGAGAASSSSLSSSSQGGAGECLLSTDCPGQDNDCGTRTCINHTCDLVLMPPGSDCSDADGSICDAEGNCVACLNDNHCDLEDYCADDHTCQGKQGLVQPCSQDNQCLSASCADGICCDGPCGGLCQACVFDKTGEANGSCTLVSAGTDPDDECPGAQLCDANGACGN